MEQLFWARKAVVAVMAATSIGATGCTATPDPSADRPEGEVVELRLNDSGQTLEVGEGDTFTVKLASNPGTGYEWEAVVDDENVLRLVDQVFAEPTIGDGADLEGAGGSEVLQFQGTAVGRATITLRYRRPWETDTEPLESVVYTVDVIAGE